MASITIPDVDDGLKHRLGVRAAAHGWSVEDEARDILRQVVGRAAAPGNLGQRIHERFAAVGGVDLDLPERGPMREPPTFD